MEVGPTCHYFMGGIRVDPDTQMTSVAGLFAAGECAAGLHGANRLGGNSLSDLIVFGKLSGIGAKRYIEALSASPQPVSDQVRDAIRGATDVLNRESGENPYVVHDKLQDCMESYVGIVRQADELTQGVEEIGRLKELAKNVKAHGSSQYNPGWHEALSLKNMLITAEAVARAALIREESRGAHTRIDYEGERDEWLKYNIVSKKGADGEMITEKVERKPPPKYLHEIGYSKIEDLESGKVGKDAPDGTEPHLHHEAPKADSI
jgi:succinate dehydrogenase / fumarate reductase flavoprotein subunit